MPQLSPIQNPPATPPLDLSSIAPATLPPTTLPKSSTTQSTSHDIVSNHHPMTTRSRSGITKPMSKFYYKAVLDYTYTKPPSYKIATQYPKWCEAMDAEFKAL